ncbi:ATP-binding protein [Sphingomonas sp. ASV193]|uniref:sensor histidine kinase n=1 Tax=Sphingomonas sp. ASV193 TaxID=3144405 RepID=UPI0032E92765
MKLEQRLFNRLVLGALAVGFALLVAAYFLVISSLNANQVASGWVNHTFQVKSTTADLMVALERSETARRGNILDPNSQRVATYQQASSTILPQLDKLTDLVADNPAQIRRIEQLRPQLLAEMTALDRSMDLIANNQAAQARTEFAAELQSGTITAIRAIATQIGAEEERRLATRIADQSQTASRTRGLLALIGLLLFASGLAAFLLVRSYTREITTARDRLHVLNTNLEGAVAERTADLKRANDEIQRFAYIVSHDLRSPLVNVMGFTAELESADRTIEQFVDRVAETAPELVDDKVRFAAREDLPEAIGFIRSSTQKMDRLINAILNLSRQGRRTLTPESLPMDKIVGEIVDSLATLASERDATIRIEGSLPGLRHDRLAVEQIFSNLIENATKYLRPGVPGEIKVRGESRGKRTIFEIEDNGRGVDPKDHERIFELFRRAGNQDQRGEGIGLAHVRSLAYRLGGTVTIRSTLGEGSTFIVDLPTTYVAEGEDK